jgi:hypothetical protein
MQLMQLYATYATILQLYATILQQFRMQLYATMQHALCSFPKNLYATICNYMQIGPKNLMFFP